MRGDNLAGDIPPELAPHGPGSDVTSVMSGQGAMQCNGIVGSVLESTKAGRVRSPLTAQ